MCDFISFTNPATKPINTIRRFQSEFNVDATTYGWDGNEEDLDTCLCPIDLVKFFKDHPQYHFKYHNGAWWETARLPKAKFTPVTEEEVSKMRIKGYKLIVP